VVHVQPASSGREDPEAVLKYLARYVAGTANSDQGLISHDGQQVTFWVKDRKRKRRFPVKLPGLEFTRRFMMHVLPKGFERVRYRGLFHDSKRNTILPKIRQQLARQAPTPTAPPAPTATLPPTNTSSGPTPKPQSTPSQPPARRVVWAG